MKKIIYTLPNGNVAVIGPCEGARLARSVTLSDGTKFSSDTKPVDQFFRRWPIQGAVADWAETEDEFVNRVAIKDVPHGIQFQIVDESSIPVDRAFRNAWVVGAGKVDHDLNKCKLIAHERRRAMRSVEFKPLDIEATIPAKAVQAEEKRQAIRDKYDAMQLSIDSAKSVDEIKATLNA